MKKFLKTVRFDDSDANVFPVAAGEAEWAVSGAFAFCDLPQDSIAGKQKQAFANGFLGLGSFGRSTFTSVAKITGEELKQVENGLASYLLDHFGAPDREAALEAARQEVAFTCELCDGPLSNTVFAVRRSFKEDGRISEQFHQVRTDEENDGAHARIWSIVEDDT